MKKPAPPDPRKPAFVRELAKYLVGDQAKMSVRLAMGNEDAQRWAALRASTPLFGYPTVEEATEQLAAWLNVPLRAS